VVGVPVCGREIRKDFESAVGELDYRQVENTMVTRSRPAWESPPRIRSGTRPSGLKLKMKTDKF